MSLITPGRIASHRRHSLTPQPELLKPQRFCYTGSWTGEGGWTLGVLVQRHRTAARPPDPTEFRGFCELREFRDFRREPCRETQHVPVLSWQELSRPSESNARWRR